MAARTSLVISALALPTLVALVGCAPQSQLMAAREQNRILGEQARAQLAEIESLKTHGRKVEDQLIEAETMLADLESRVGSDRRRISNYELEREQLRDEFGDATQGGAPLPRGVSERLHQLARRNRDLRFDPQTGLAKFDTDVLFESGKAELRPDSERLLDELAELLRAPEAAEMKVMVVGHTDDRTVGGRRTRENYPDNWHLSAARALAVADYLLAKGVREEQLGVAGYGRHQPIASNDGDDERRRNRRVEIFVMGPDTPVVGWTETITSVY